MAESVTERRIRPIEEAAEAGNWKQALKECDKWHKKGEKSDKFLALRANVLVHHPDQAQQSRGEKEALLLVQRKPALVDRAAMDLLTKAFNHLEAPQHISEMWDRAIASGTNKELNLYWLDYNVDGNNWVNAQKATVALRKAFPKERQYEFWNILMYYLIFLDQQVPQAQRELSGTLAYRMLANAAKNVPADEKQLLSPGKAITTPEELYLLVAAYVDTGHASDAVDLLISSTFSHSSQIGQQDPQLHCELLLRALEFSRLGDRNFSICQDLLQIPDYRSDDRLWTILLRSSANSVTDRSNELDRIFAEHTHSGLPYDHSAMAANMKYVQSQIDTVQGTSAVLLSLCKSYFYHQKGRSNTFRNLIPHLRALNDQDQTSFRSFLTQESSTNRSSEASLAVIKFDYSICPLPESLLSLLVRARTALEYYQDADRSCLMRFQSMEMAALDMIRASMLSSNIEYLVRAIVVLELCRSQNENAFSLSVLLIECYLKLGLCSRAIERFQGLTIKNLQFENAGHLLLNRISTTYPHEYQGRDRLLDPLEQLRAGTKHIDKANVAISEGIKEGLRFGSFSNVIDGVCTQRKLTTSINLWLYHIEGNKIVRTTDDSPAHVLPVPQVPLADQRDYSFFPSYSNHDGRLHGYLSCGPRSGIVFIRCMLYIENVIVFLEMDLMGKKASAQGSYERTKFIDIITSISSEELGKEMTMAEIRNFAAVLDLRRIIHWVKEEGQSNPELINQYVRRVDRYIHDVLRWAKYQTTSWEKCFGKSRAVRGVNIPVWEFLHNCYTSFELCRIFALFLRWMKKQRKGKATPQPKQASEEVDEGALEELAETMTTLWPNSPESNGRHDGGNPGTEAGDSSPDSDLKQNGIVILDQDLLHVWGQKVQKIHIAVRDQAIMLTDSINKPRGVAGRLVDVAFGHDPEETDEGLKEENVKWEEVLGKLCEEKVARDVVQETCNEMVESWRDATQSMLLKSNLALVNL